MHVVVTIKQVIDPLVPPAHLRLNAATRQVDAPAGIAPAMNGYDANALEEALKLVGVHGGTVTVVSLGGDSVRDTLRRGIALGTTGALHITDPGYVGWDALDTAHVLATAIARYTPDLVLCGRQASDTDAGQVLFGIAEALGWPVVSPVRAIHSIEETGVVVDRLTERGTQKLLVALPAVLGISSEANEPRTPAVRSVMAANRARIPAVTRSELGLNAEEGRVVLRRLSRDVHDSHAEIIAGATPAETGAKLADALHAAGLI